MAGNNTGRSGTSPIGCVRVALFLGALVAANPVVVLAISGSSAVTGAVLLGVIALLQAAYRSGRESPLLPYAANLVLLGSLLLHAEYVLRTSLRDVAVPGIYRAEASYYFNRPRLRLTFEDAEYRALYVTDSEGLRIGENRDPERPITTADWVFVGDSFTQGAQVAFETLYTSQLYRQFPDRIIVNLGASGLGIAEELALYEARGAPLKPSIVFLQLSPFNDFMNVQPRSIGMGSRLTERLALFRTATHALRYEDPRDLPLGRWTEPFYPDRESNRRFNVFYRETCTTKEQDVKLLRHYLGAFKEAVQRDGARLVVVLLPTREQVVPAALAEVQEAFGIDSAQLDMLRPNVIMNHLGRDVGVEVVDLLDLFRAEGAGAFFEGDEHLTPRGHAAVAEGVRMAVRRWPKRAAFRARSSRLEGERYPRFSCESSRILYQAPSGGSTEVFTLDLASSGVRQLTVDGPPKTHPMLSNACDQLLYTQGDPNGNRTEVVLMDRASGRTSVLTAGRGEYGAIPFISPDGRYVAYAEWKESAASGQLTNPVIVIMDLKSRHKTYVTEDSHESWRPAFDADGQSLVFISRRAGQFDLYVYDLAKRTTRQLTATAYDEWDPSFSASGRQVVYAARRDANWDLFVVDTESGAERRLTHTRGDEWDPVFGPGDQSVLFAGEFGMFAGIYELDLRP